MVTNRTPQRLSACLPRLFSDDEAPGQPLLLVQVVGIPEEVCEFSPEEAKEHA
jgi:hypothetical protein